MDEINVLPLRKDSVVPSKNDEEGCFDAYASPGEDEIIINPGEIVLVPLGISSAFDKSYRVALRERGSNVKSKLQVWCGQIDSGFRGEWFAPLQNHGETTIVMSHKYDHLFEGEVNEKKTYALVLEKNEITFEFLAYNLKKAVCQFAVEPVPPVKIVVVDDLSAYASIRGEGMMGSSGK